MMNKQEHMITILMEEAAEAIVEASKCQRFTLDQKYIESNFTNRERLQREIKDFISVAQILLNMGVLDSFMPTVVEIERKRVKIEEKFMALSRDYGALQGD